MVNYPDFERTVQTVAKLESEIVRLRGYLAFCGVTISEDGSLEVNVRKFNAGHRCEKHRSTDYQVAPDYDRCTQCLADLLKSLAGLIRSFDMREIDLQEFQDRYIPLLAELDSLL